MKSIAARTWIVVHFFIIIVFKVFYFYLVVKYSHFITVLVTKYENNITLFDFEVSNGAFQSVNFLTANRYRIEEQVCSSFWNAFFDNHFSDSFINHAVFHPCYSKSELVVFKNYDIYRHPPYR